MEKYPRSFFKERLEVKDRKKWILESKNFAKLYVYEGLTRKQKIDDDYIKRAKPIIMQ